MIVTDLAAVTRAHGVFVITQLPSTSTFGRPPDRLTLKAPLLLLLTALFLFWLRRSVALARI
jgi:hypothetical protein